MGQAELEYFVSVDSDKGKRDLHEFGDEFEKVGKKGKSGTAQAARGLDSLFGKFTNLNQAAELAKKAFHLLSLPLEKIISVGSMFEDTQLQLETVLGSAAKAREYFEWIKKFSSTTPFQIEGLTESTILLESFGINAQKYLRTFGDAAAGLKTPLNELARVMGQIFSKPKASAEEMLQLVERGVPVMKILQSEMGLTKKQIGDIGNYAIEGTKVFEALAKGMQKLYGGAMDKMSKSFTGLWSTTKDKFVLFLAEIAGPVLENLKEKLGSLLKQIDQWAKDGTLEKWGREIAEAFSTIIGLIAGVAKIIWSLREPIVKVGSALLIMLAIAKVKAFAAAFPILTASVGSSTFAIAAYTTTTKAATVVMHAFKAALPIAAIAAAIAVISRLKSLLSDLIDQYDRVNAAEQREHNNVIMITRKFQDFQKYAGISSQQMIEMRTKVRETYGELSNVGVEFAKLMQMAGKGMFGDEMKQKYREWQATLEQHADILKVQGLNVKQLLKIYGTQKEKILGNKKALEEWIKRLSDLNKTALPEEQKRVTSIIETLKKKRKALADASGETKKLQKEVEKYAEKLKLVDAKRLTKETDLLVKALKLKSGQLENNQEALVEVGKKVEELINKYKALGKEPPKELEKLKVKFDLLKGPQIDVNKELDNMSKEFEKITPEVVVFGVQIDLVAQSQKQVEGNTRNLWEALLDLAPTLMNVAGLISQATGIFNHFGIISDELAEKIDGVASGIGQIGAGLDQIGKKDASLWDKLSGGLSVFSGAASIATSAFSALLSLFKGKSGELEAAERFFSGFGLSEEWLKKIEERAQEIGGEGSTERASAEFLDDIIRSTKITLDNFDLFINKVRDIGAVMQWAGVSAQETAANYGAAFAEMTKAAEDLGLLGSQAMIGLIENAEKLGLKVQEIQDFTKKEFNEAFAGYKDVLEVFGDAHVKIFDQAIHQEKVLASIPPELMKGIDGAARMVIHLSNMKRLDNEEWAEFNRIADQSIIKLQEQGITGVDAAIAMKPLLERLAFLQQQFGFKVSESTQALIDQGIEAGVLSEDFRSESQIMKEGFQEVVGAIKDLTRVLRGDLPEAFDSLTGRAGIALDNIGRQADLLRQSFADVEQQVGVVGSSVENLDKIITDKMTGHSMVPETQKLAEAFKNVSNEVENVQEKVTILGKEYTPVMGGMDTATRELWLRSLEDIEKKKEDLIRKREELQRMYELTMVQNVQNTEKWKRELEIIEREMLGTNLPEKLEALRQKHQNIEAAMAADTMMYQDQLYELKRQLGEDIPSALATLEQQHAQMVGQMSGQMSSYYQDAAGKLWSLQDIIKQGATDLSGRGFSSSYGIFGLEESTDAATQLRRLWEDWGKSQDKIISSPDYMKAFYQKFSNIDRNALEGIMFNESKSYQDMFDYWARSWKNWKTHVVDWQQTWDAATRSWIGEKPKKTDTKEETTDFSSPGVLPRKRTLTQPMPLPSTLASSVPEKGGVHIDQINFQVEITVDGNIDDPDEFGRVFVAGIEKNTQGMRVAVVNATKDELRKRGYHV